MEKAQAKLPWRQRPEVLIYFMAAAVPLSFAVWQGLILNFVVEIGKFGSAERGIQESIREIPGFLAFGVVFLLLIIREQKLAYVSLLLLGVGTALTGYFPSVFGIYCMTVLMSIGYHYYETVQQSVSLQWVEKERAPQVFGKIVAAGAFTTIGALTLVLIAVKSAEPDYNLLFLVGGGMTCLIAVICWLVFPKFPDKVRQHRHMVIRRRYWLYYALTFMSGARRQIFTVFAAYLMVEKFDYERDAIITLMLITAVLNTVIAPLIGRLVGRWGERKALIFEYIGLIGVFTSYAFVDNHLFASGLYIIDNLFFALAIAIKTYFQKIAAPEDIASTAGVSFTINHIAAVVIPAAFGLLWLVSPALVFLSGAAMAAGSLALSFLVPTKPEEGNETLYMRSLSGEKATAPLSP